MKSAGKISGTGVTKRTNADRSRMKAPSDVSGDKLITSRSGRGNLAASGSRIRNGAGGAARNTALLIASNTGLSTAKASGSMALVTKIRALQHMGSEQWIGLTRGPARTCGPAGTRVNIDPYREAAIESSA